MIKKNNQGFTLIELLIVIVLIGILSGVLLSVIQPGAQRDRANQTIMKSNLDKLLMAVKVCTAVSKTPHTSCDSLTEVSANSPDNEPVTGTTYLFTVVASPNIQIHACMGGNATYADCTGAAIQYTYNTTTGVTTIASKNLSIEMPTKI